MELSYNEFKHDIESTQDLINCTHDIVFTHDFVFIFLHEFEEFEIITNIPILDTFYDIEPEFYT